VCFRAECDRDLASVTEALAVPERLYDTALETKRSAASFSDQQRWFLLKAVR
jgi:hypothetical protein